MRTVVHFQPKFEICQMSLECRGGSGKLANITENESALVLGSLVSAKAMLELGEWGEIVVLGPVV